VTLLPRTIRLDASDTVVFARAAEPGEWAVPGTFLYWERPAESLSRKEHIAFRSGFLGVESFGHSTLVVVQEATEADRAAMVAALARALVAHLGAPDIATASPAAEEEVVLAESLCRGHAPNTLIALHRTRDDRDIREQFRTLRPRQNTAFDAPYLQGHDRAFHVVEEDEEGIDLIGLHGGRNA
jgi:hypothetical protein